MTDLTLRAVQRQIKAMGVDRFEVGILDASGGKEAPMTPRTWDIETLTKSIGWLKRQNFDHNHIFIRPAGSQGIVLVEDIEMGGLTRIEKDGLKPALIIESSPMSFHVWIRVSDSPITPELATSVCKTLAIRYGGDPNSADWRHYGRLAGFTNRKDEHVREDGSYPFVMIRSSTMKSSNYIDSPAIQKLLADANAHRQETVDRNEERLKRLRAARQNAASIDDLPDGKGFYLAELAVLEKRYANDLDLSTCDWQIGQKMAEKGYSPDQIMLAILEASPDLATRHAGAVEGYLERTVNNLFGQNGRS